MVVMPGGVDIHSHVASSSVNHARRVLPDEHTADPAAAPDLLRCRRPLGHRRHRADHVHHRLPLRRPGLHYRVRCRRRARSAPATRTRSWTTRRSSTAGFFVLMGNDEYLLRQIDAGERDRARDYAAWLFGATGGYAIKIVNPGGVELWKRNVRARDKHRRCERPVRCDAARDPGNAGRRRERPRLAAPGPHPLQQPRRAGQRRDDARRACVRCRGRRAHFTHLQFHAYGGGADSRGRRARTSSSTYVNAHPEVTADVGQVMFGHATTVTADGPVEYLLHASSGRRWVNVDIELETGCGIVPYDVPGEAAAVASLQWVVGLELFLLSDDPWRVVLSTDHPNGGVVHELSGVDPLADGRAYRDERLKRVNQKLLAGSALADGFSREYTLRRDRDHHARRSGPSARPDAARAIWRRAPTRTSRSMRGTPTSPRCSPCRDTSIKGGTLVVEEGQLRRAPATHRLHVRPQYDAAVMRDVSSWFDRYGTIAFDNYPVAPPARCAGSRRRERLTCKSAASPSKTRSPKRSACAARA